MDLMQELQNPATTPERLAQIAAEHPQFAAQIGEHPNAYPELRAWAAQKVAEQGQDAPEPPKKKRNTALIVSLSVIAGLVVIGLILYAVFSSQSGASSAEAAAEKFVTSVAKADMMGVVSTLPKTETEEIMRAASWGAEESGLSSQKLDANQTKMLALVQDLGTAADIKLEGLQFGQEPIAEGIVRVSLTAGTATVNGDPEKIKSAFGELMDAALEESDAGQDAAASIAMVEEALSGELDDLQGASANFAELSQSMSESGMELSLIAVEENGNWFVSPLMTMADYAYQAAEFSEGQLPLGSEVVAATQFESPADAATGLVDATASGNLNDIAAAMPLAERRLLSIYGPAMAQALETSPDNLWPGTPIEVASQSWSDEDHGDWALVNADEVILSAEGESVAFTGDCMVTTSSASCLSDLLNLSELNLDRGILIATQENGGWLVNPSATLWFWVGRISTLEGFLDDLMSRGAGIPEGLLSGLEGGSDSPGSLTDLGALGAGSDSTNGEQSILQACQIVENTLMEFESRSVALDEAVADDPDAGSEALKEMSAFLSSAGSTITNAQVGKAWTAFTDAYAMLATSVDEMDEDKANTAFELMTEAGTQVEDLCAFTY